MVASRFSRAWSMLRIRVGWSGTRMGDLRGQGPGAETEISVSCRGEKGQVREGPGPRVLFGRISRLPPNGGKRAVRRAERCEQKAVLYAWCDHEQHAPGLFADWDWQKVGE